MPPRRTLRARLAELEANRPPLCRFTLEDGQAVSLSAKSMLVLLHEALTAAYAPDDADTPVSDWLALLGTAVSGPDDSLLTGALIGAARALAGHEQDGEP